MRIAVGLIEDAPEVRVTLEGTFRDADGSKRPPGEYRFTRPEVLEPLEPETAAFVLHDFRIGHGFHWERRRPSAFRGGLRLVAGPGGLTAINDVDLEADVESFIASEMSPESPVDLLRAHAVISRSWVVAQIGAGGGAFHSRRERSPGEWEITAWYGRQRHAGFDVCADDHCQRYQGVPDFGTERAWRTVQDTRGRFLVFDGQVCDARFSKCCGGVTEDFRSAWEDRDVPYLRSVHDGAGVAPRTDEGWLRSDWPGAYCSTGDAGLLGRIFTSYDRETADFFRWRVDYSRRELGELVRSRTGIDIGEPSVLEPLERGPSGRIVRLRIQGRRASLTLGKELEIRRVLSESHLYSSAFAVNVDGDRIVLSGAGWGHGVGLCQVGAAVMAEGGASFQEILRHYYPGAAIEERSRA